MTISPPTPPSHRQSAFSLAEMMIVVGIIGFLLAMTAPNLFSLLRSNELSTQGDMIKGWLSQAQQTALSSNSDVEVRFFEFSDSFNADADDQFRAIQFYQFNTNGALEPRSPIFRLRSPVILSKKFSNILSDGDIDRGTLTGEQVQRVFGSGVTESVSYRSFRYRPSGATDLPHSKTWYLTMVEDQNTGTEVPKNFVCIQIDAYNGSLREYRP